MRAISSDLPGAELVEQGLHDLEAGSCTIASLVVSIGAPRLRALGLEVSSPFEDAEHALYLLLSQSDADAAHGRYNALVRRLVSFERAATCAAWRPRRASEGSSRIWGVRRAPVTSARSR